MNDVRRLCLILLLVLACSACRSKQRRAAEPAEQPPPLEAGQEPQPWPKVDAIRLQSLPVATNWDGRPGADGFQVRLYFFQADQPLSVHLRRGRIEMLMFEGRVPPADLDRAQPLQAWPYDADPLRSLGSDSAVGWGYSLLLGWKQKPPTATVTITSRLLRPGHAPLYAPPLYLSTAAR